MHTMPPVELLEKTHAFPCPYVFKVIGRPEQGLVARAVAAVRLELTLEVDPPYHVRETPGGAYVSITLEPVVANAEQVLAVYRRLTKLVGLVMLL